jgi:hypothetical protein
MMPRMRSAILTYHSLDLSGSVISTAPRLFARQMEWLASSGIRVVPLASVREIAGAVAVTFDDGYRNFISHAWPVLRQYGFPATIFVVSGYCGRTNEWSSQGRWFPRLPLMDWEELRELSRERIEIGAHSVNHDNLSRLEPRRAVAELRGSRASIEDEIGTPVRAFAYPYGASTPEVRELARREFAFCCGTRLAFTDRDSDPANLPRLDVFYLRRMFWWSHLMDSWGGAYVACRRLLRDIRP